MRVLVIGGAGHLGSATVQALQSLPEARVDVGGRSGPVELDLTDTGSFGVLQAYDYVVNCSDSITAPPDDVIARCLESRPVFLETSSHRPTIERLLERFYRRQGDRGLAILGAGVFTGLSNLLGAAAAGPGCEHLELGVAFSPLSSGGGGMVNLAVHMLGTPTSWYRGGQRQFGGAMEPGPTLPFPLGPLNTLRVPFAEPMMLSRSTRVPDIDLYWGAQPQWLRTPSLLLARLVPRTVAASGLYRALLTPWLKLLRTRLLKDRPTGVSLVARGHGSEPDDDRESVDRTLSLHTPDGIASGGLAIAAMVQVLELRATRTSGLWSGLYMPDEMLSLDEVLEAMAQIGPRELCMPLQGSSAP